MQCNLPNAVTIGTKLTRLFYTDGCRVLINSHYKKAMNINEMWSKAIGCHCFQLNVALFIQFYEYRDNFCYFKLKISYRLFNRHARVIVNDIVEVFGCFSITLLPIQEDFSYNFVNTIFNI